MYSNAVGVQARIRRGPTCSLHSLQQSLSEPCPGTRLVNNSSKKHVGQVKGDSVVFLTALLTNIIHTFNPHDTRRKSLLDLCKTRWAECHKADQHFYQAYTYIVKCLEVIAYGLHKDEGFDDDLAKNGNKDRNSKARQKRHHCSAPFVTSSLLVPL